MVGPRAGRRVDTTWSAIGSSLWHLATHPDDAAALVARPELMDSAVEELLRADSPVTMARIVTEDTEFKGCPMHKGDKVLMNFPAANRDPAVFDRPDEVVLDRSFNRHVAFGSGIHRCAGSNLARMELKGRHRGVARSDPDVPHLRRGGRHLGGRPGPRAADASGRLSLTAGTTPSRRCVPGPGTRSSPPTPCRPSRARTNK